MKVKEIKLEKNHDGSVPYINSVLPVIPSNVLIDKSITGCGITYTEITASRHSLIIESYKSVCISKAMKHKNILSVTRDQTVDDILDYMMKRMKRNEYIKLITVPENLPKIQEASDILGIDITRDFFFLLDECQHPVQNSGWRPSLLLPLDIFFQSCHRAAVSATPLIMSDERFEKQGFQMLRIVPQWDYRVEARLIITNNTLVSLCASMTKYKDDTQLLIGCKSIRVIMALIKQFNIMGESAVFCSQESADKLKDEDFKHAYTQVEEKHLKQYNFMTSRFFDAVDIDLSFKPHLLLVSDVIARPHTLVDPATEAYQLTGRCRAGIQSFTVITNTNNTFPHFSDSEIDEILSCHRHCWQTISTLMETQNEQHLRTAYHDVRNSLPYTQLLDSRTGYPNAFLEDNWKKEFQLKSIYSEADSIIKAYKDCGKFILTVESEHWSYDDWMRLKLENPMISQRERWKIIVDCLDNLESVDGSFKQDILAGIKAYDADILEAYNLLGGDAIRDMRFVKKKIRQAVVAKKAELGTTAKPFLEMVYATFPLGVYPVSKIKKELCEIYKKLKVTPSGAVTARNIEQFFICERKTRKIKKKSTECYILHDKKM